jgi:hypothetical protein
LIWETCKPDKEVLTALLGTGEPANRKKCASKCESYPGCLSRHCHTFCLRDGHGNWMNRLNFETRSTYTLTVLVKDTIGLVGYGQVNIVVKNVNEAPLIFAQTRSIKENSVVYTNVGMPIQATDYDKTSSDGFSEQIDYMIVSESLFDEKYNKWMDTVDVFATNGVDNVFGTGFVFMIHPLKGQIMVSNEFLNYEEYRTYKLNVRVNDYDDLFDRNCNKSFIIQIVVIIDTNV